MKIICVFASLLLAANAFSVASRNNESDLVECRGWKDLENIGIGSQTIVTSPNFGDGDYENNENCLIVFHTQEQPFVLRLNFTDFELEEDFNLLCSWDSFCLSGSKHCGRSLNGRILSYYVPADKTFTMVFKSDSTVTRSGFRVIVDALPARSQGDVENYEDTCLTGKSILYTMTFSPFNYISNFSSSDYDYLSNYINSDYVYSPDDSDNYYNFSGEVTDDGDNYYNFSGEVTDDGDNYYNFSGEVTDGGDNYYNFSGEVTDDGDNNYNFSGEVTDDGDNYYNFSGEVTDEGDNNYDYVTEDYVEYPSYDFDATQEEDNGAQK